MQRAGGQDGPNPFAPFAPFVTACALSNMTVYGHEPDGLFGPVVGGFHPRGRDELKIRRPVLAQAFCDALCITGIRHVALRLAQDMVARLA